jgi:hypothetical protein
MAAVQSSLHPQQLYQVTSSLELLPWQWMLKISAYQKQHQQQQKQQTGRLLVSLW